MLYTYYLKDKQGMKQHNGMGKEISHDWLADILHQMNIKKISQHQRVLLETALEEVTIDTNKSFEMSDEKVEEISGILDDIIKSSEEFRSSEPQDITETFIPKSFGQQYSETTKYADYISQINKQENQR